MKHKFVSLFAVAAFILGAAVLHAAVPVQSLAEVSSPDATDDEGDLFTTPSDFPSSDVAFKLSSDAAPAATGTAVLLTRPDVGTSGALSTTLASSSLNGPQVSVPLPEPSSQVAVYVLSGVVGLGFVVMRRRTA